MANTDADANVKFQVSFGSNPGAAACQVNLLKVSSSLLPIWQVQRTQVAYGFESGETVFNLGSRRSDPLCRHRQLGGTGAGCCSPWLGPKRTIQDMKELFVLEQVIRDFAEVRAAKIW